MPYTAHRRLSAPAQTRPELWRLALGVLAIFALGSIMNQSAIQLVAVVLEPDGAESVLRRLTDGDGVLGTLGSLAMIATLGLATALVAVLLHERSLGSLIGPLPLALRQFLRAIGPLLLLHAIMLGLPPWPAAGDVLSNMAFGSWMALLPLTVLVLIAQCGAEELFFRGYLQSQLAARQRHPIVWLGLPSALFALAHYAPGLYGGNAWPVVAWAFLFGLAAADLTARAGTLGPALAFHLINNLIPIALIAPLGPMSGAALFTLSHGFEEEARIAQTLPLELSMVVVGWLVVRLTLRR